MSIDRLWSGYRLVLTNESAHKSIAVEQNAMYTLGCVKYWSTEKNTTTKESPAINVNGKIRAA